MIEGKDLWFPNYVWTGTLDVDKEALKTYSDYKIKDKWDNDRLLGDKRPWSSVDFVLEECEAVVDMVKLLNEVYAKICEEIGFKPVQLYNIWVNKNPPGVKNPSHTHIHHAGTIGALFSGVYYLDADKDLDQGDIVFERNDQSAMHIPHQLKTQNTPYNMPEARYKSETGDLYCFSSWIPHRVTKNNSDKDRYSISFNYGV